MSPLPAGVPDGGEGVGGGVNGLSKYGIAFDPNYREDA
jgi:hypothetical protein